MTGRQHSATAVRWSISSYKDAIMSERTEHSWSVDGIEEGIVRIEEDGERMLSIPQHLLPAGAREGQLLRVTRAFASGSDSVVVTIALDHAATTAALRKSQATMSQAMTESAPRDPGGDVIL